MGGSMKRNNGDKKSSNGALIAAPAAPPEAAVGRSAVEWAFMPERRASPRASAGPDFQEEVRRVLLGRYTPAAVLVDDALNVVHVHGHVSPFLEPPGGAPAVNLTKMAKGDLAIVIRAAVLKAKSEDQPVSKRVRCALNGQAMGLTIEVITIRSRSDRRRHYLVLFRPDAPLARAAEETGARG